jgi:acyl dehydratase
VRTFTTADELMAAEGETLGTSEWLTIDQERINTFAEATGDHQWIHVDPERAASGPFGSTIAHGYLTLSLLPALSWQVWEVKGVQMGVNVGSNRVRFLNPVKVGSRVRATGVLTSVKEASGGIQVVVTQTIEIDGADKPACIAETVSRLYF